MKPAPFDYLRPGDVGEALAALAEAGDEARIMAGGQSLAAMLNMRLVQPGLLVDIARLDALAGIALRDGALEVGAAVTQAGLLARPTLAAELPLVAAALPWVGHFQTRNRGTVCGSIAHADPSAELPLCLVATGGEVVLRSVRRRRVLPAADFFRGVLSTACGPEEMVEAVRFPLAAAGTGHAFREMAMRHGDFALVAVAASAGPAGLRLAVGGVAERPAVRDWPADLDGSALDDAVNDFAWSLGARDDQHASARYRRDLVRHLGRIAIGEARIMRGEACRG